MDFQQNRLILLTVCRDFYQQAGPPKNPKIVRFPFPHYSPLVRVRSVNALGFTAGMQKTSGSDPLVFMRPSGFEKIQPTEKSIG